MQIGTIINFLETIAPPSLQESYDNSGLLTGMPNWECSGALVSLDITDEVIDEAISFKCNLLIAHHPLIFKGLKRLNGNDQVSRIIIRAIKNDLAIYAIHTNLDNVIEGVNGKIADLIGLEDRKILLPQVNRLKKIICFTPIAHFQQVREAIFNTGAGQIGEYSGCSFSSEGTGTFTAAADTHPFIGEIGQRHQEKEVRLEVVFPSYLERQVISAMTAAHPYEEVAYDILSIDNIHQGIGSGISGFIASPVPEGDFLRQIRDIFHIPAIRHSKPLGKPIQHVSLCGGAGSFLISKAIANESDIFLTADLKYHDFFEADGRILLADIGHFESEQFTSDLVYGLIKEKFPTFAVLKTGVLTNPINYFF
jgi:dinuclear metal center YbgI/SA1388 family protein